MAKTILLKPNEAELDYRRALEGGRAEEYVRDRLRHLHIEEDIRYAILRLDGVLRVREPDWRLYRYLHDLVVGAGAAWSRSTKNGTKLHVNRLCGTIYWAGRADEHTVTRRLGEGKLCTTCRRRLLGGDIDWRYVRHPDFDGEPQLTRVSISRGW
jgi:hypothetical protein